MPTASSQHSSPLSPRRDGRADTSTVRRRRDVPEAIRSLGALANADYADIVTATVDETPAEPEQVVHAVLNGLPRALLAALVWPPVSLIHRQVALAPVRSAIRVQ